MTMNTSDPTFEQFGNDEYSLGEFSFDDTTAFEQAAAETSDPTQAETYDTSTSAENRFYRFNLYVRFCR